MKRGIFIASILVLFLVISLFSLFIINAEDIDGVVSVVDNEDGGDSGGGSSGGSLSTSSNLVENIENYSGEIDPETGLPKKILDPMKKVEEGKKRLEDSEKRESWFKEILTNFGRNKFVVVTKDVSGKFFSFFDFYWGITLKTEFSWALGFFISFLIWLLLVVIITIVSKDIFDNWLFGIVTGIVVASLSGIFGVISVAANIILTMVTSLLGLTIFFIIVIAIIVIVGKLMKKFRKQSEEEELDEAKRETTAFGNVARKFLGELGGKK